jgi:CRISPR-associated protein Cmr4
MSDLILYVYAESPVHAGAGTGIGAIDLPIQREQITQYPMIQGGGVKGALRSHVDEDRWGSEKSVVFGPETTPGQPPANAGCITVGDARLLLFPIRSLKGVFVWTTSRSVLARFLRDCHPGNNVPALPDEPAKDHAYATNAVCEDGKVVLEDFMYLQSNPNPNLAAQWGEWLRNNALPSGDVYDTFYRPSLKQKLVILPDDDFRDFVRYSTQVITRIALDDGMKTVSDGPFTIELLPAESLLYVPMGVQKPRAEHPTLKTRDSVKTWLTSQAFGQQITQPHIQIGGDETTGYGQVTLHWGN